MKKKFFLGWCFLTLITMLNSCSWFNIKKTVKITDEGLVYNNQLYNVSISDFEYYSFYRVEGEYVSTTFIADGLTWVDLYVVDNPDFGLALRPTNTLLDSKIETEYVFSENTIIPDAKNLIIDNIIIISAAFSDHKSNYQSMESLISSDWSKVIQIRELKDSKESISLNQIIDFESSIVLEKIEFTMYRECIAFIPKEYSSFYCGIYNVIEYENALYIEVGDDHELFKIHDEYQEDLKKIITENNKT